MHDKNAVRRILNDARTAKREALTAPEARGICEAYGIAIPKEGVAKSAEQAVKLASDIGFPVVMKIVSPQILHKTEAGGVVVGVKSADAARDAYAAIVGNAKKYDAKAEILGVQVQQMLPGGQEVIIGAVTDPAFGKLVAFGLGGILVEVLKDITFRLAPATKEDARVDARRHRGGRDLARRARRQARTSGCACGNDRERVDAGRGLSRDIGNGFESGIRNRQGRDRRRRAHRARLQPGPPARSSEPGGHRREDDPHHEAESGGGDRRIGRERQDRQFRDEES